MLTSEWLVLARTPAEYKGVLAHAKTLDPSATLAFFNVFHFHPHDDEQRDIAKLLHPAPRWYPVEPRAKPPVARRDSVSVSVSSQGPSQDIPTNGEVWQGFGDIRIIVSSRVTS